MKIYAPAISALIFLVACSPEQMDLQPLIEQRAAERLNGFRNNFRKECQTEVLEVARLRADSLLRERARRMRTLAGRPPKPNRPGTPPEKSLSKELPLRPLFPFEIRFDTLLRDSLFLDSIRLDSLFQLRVDSLKLDSINRGLLLPDKPQQ